MIAIKSRCQLITGISIFMLMLINMPAIGQKYDYNWLFNNPFPDSINLVSFQQGKVSSEAIFSSVDIFISTTNATASNEQGKFQFATNGCFIIGPDYQLMENGDRLNFNAAYRRYCQSTVPFYFNGHQSCIVLPDPSERDRYYLIHNSKYWGDSAGTAAMLYTQIDMKANGGLGRVTSKNNVLVGDSSIYGTVLTAVKHANGKDWWLINPLLYENGYVRFLLDSNGFSEPMYQYNVGIAWDPYYNYGGAAQFTPDGKKYIRWSGYDGTYIYSFDRETGLLSDFQWLDNRIDTNFVVFAGMAVSPNSRFLYLSSLVDLYQYDLEADDILFSAVKVGSWDPNSTLRPIPNIWAGQLGPDCRIYFTSTSGVKNLHVIHQPDLKGKSCDFRYNSYSLPAAHGTSIPHFPNYRLDSGPVCDPGIVITGTRNIPEVQGVVRVYPNPASDNFEVDITGGYDRLELFDINGRAVMTHYQQGKVDVSQLPQGLYVLRAWKGDQLVGIGKVTVGP